MRDEIRDRVDLREQVVERAADREARREEPPVDRRTRPSRDRRAEHARSAARTPDRPSPGHRRARRRPAPARTAASTAVSRAATRQRSTRGAAARRGVALALRRPEAPERRERRQRRRPPGDVDDRLGLRRMQRERERGDKRGEVRPRTRGRERGNPASREREDEHRRGDVHATPTIDEAGGRGRGASSSTTRLALVSGRMPGIDAATRSTSARRASRTTTRKSSYWKAVRRERRTRPARAATTRPPREWRRARAGHVHGRCAPGAEGARASSNADSIIATASHQRSGAPSRTTITRVPSRSA